MLNMSTNSFRKRRGRQTQSGVVFLSDDVWAAACAAQRINGEYLKEDKIKINEDGSQEILKKRNRDIMMDFLCVSGTITDEDRNAGDECRKFLQNDLTFRALKGQLTDFDQSMSRVVAVSDVFDSVQHRLELAVVACLPQSYQRALARQAIQNRVRSATGGYVGDVGNKVTVTAEIVSANYSQNYGIFWVTAITKNNQALFFSYKSQLNSGNQINLIGTVKAHRDSQTQLNRVKIL